MSKNQPPVYSGDILEEGEWLTLQQLTVVCRVQRERIVAMVDEGIVEPQGAVPEQWRFPPHCVSRARAVLRLEYDLGVNLPGAALILDLREEVERLRTLLDRHSARFF